ncbi:hypothetical protein ACFPYJ_22995 [Paenibacillus solisilvae]|uniref:Uncharacterized protein n=1 Tax=Paenibacillus solisilvae TaxID=2486751 RepID=A0ABW0W3A3_9BACL
MIADILNRMEKLGYKAEAVPFKHREKAISQQKRKLLISAILSFPLFWAMVSHFLSSGMQSFCVNILGITPKGL